MVLFNTGKQNEEFLFVASKQIVKNASCHTSLSLIIFCTINPINLVKYLLFKYKLCLSV